MADAVLKRRIHEVLKQGYFSDPQDFVDVSDGDVDDTVHVVVVSRKFDGKRLKEKHDLVASELTQRLVPEEWGNISLIVGRSPEEIKAW